MKKQTGAILLEALLAIVVFVMVIFAIVPMLSFLLRRSERSKYEARAALLLQEGQEVAYNVLLDGWGDHPDGTYKRAHGPRRWKLLSSNDGEKNLETRFDRKITISSACRTANGNLFVECNRGTADPNTKVVTTEITWEE